MLEKRSIYNLGIGNHKNFISASVVSFGFSSSTQCDGRSFHFFAVIARAFLRLIMMTLFCSRRSLMTSRERATLTEMISS